MTIVTLKFLRNLLSQQQVSAETDNIVELAGVIFEARKELDQAIKEAQ